MDVPGYKFHEGACIYGHNIATTYGKTRFECTALCDAEAACMAIEIGVNHGGVHTGIAVGTCFLQSVPDLSVATPGYSGYDWNVDVYVKLPR